MTKKRFEFDSEVGFIDTQKCGGDTMTLFEVLVKLNKLNEENEQLKQTIKTICKDYENHHGMDIRNAEWFTAW